MSSERSAGCLKPIVSLRTARGDDLDVSCSNLLFVASATAAILGLTWGGVTYSWSSVNVLVPLILGLAGIVAFVYLERFSKHPTVPFEILTHYTSVAGYVICFLHSLLVLAIRECPELFENSLPRRRLTKSSYALFPIAVYFFPVYLQSVVGDSAIQSGVHCFTLRYAHPGRNRVRIRPADSGGDLLENSFTIAPCAMLVGFSIAKTGHYKLQTVIGLGFILVGMGLMTLLTGHSKKAAWVG